MNNQIQYSTSEEIENILKQQKFAIALFTGSKNSEGVSWCPDCNDIEPIFKSKILPEAQSLGINVFVIQVGERDVWKNPNNINRVRNSFKVKCVPTLLRVENGVETKKLEEAMILKEDLLQDFFE